jgi:HSP20 family protein
VTKQFLLVVCLYNDIDFFTFKQRNMSYNQSCAAKGDYSGNRNRHLSIRSMQRAAVNVYKTETSYEMLVFAPGRIKENFSLGVKGNELTITYTPPEGFPRFDWIQREYSRGGFVRSFTLDTSIDTSKISAKYVDGVLQVSLPLLEGKEVSKQEIPIS